MKIGFILALVLACSPALTQTQTDNAELTALFTADQAARQGKNIDWTKLGAEDVQRESVLHRMLEEGSVRTGNDYYHAAMVFQHGQRPEDYLLAHVLAVNAVSLGKREARWLAAATLDRYLLSVAQPQIYGTQFGSEPGSDIVTQRTINSALLTDSVRSVLCVVPLEEQKKILADKASGGPLRGTGIHDCR